MPLNCVLKYGSDPIFFHVHSLLLEICIVFVFGIMKNAAVNIGAQVPIWVPAFGSSGYMPKNMLDSEYFMLCVFYHSEKNWKGKERLAYVRSRMVRMTGRAAGL